MKARKNDGAKRPEFSQSIQNMIPSKRLTLLFLITLGFILYLSSSLLVRSDAYVVEVHSIYFGRLAKSATFFGLAFFSQSRLLKPFRLIITAAVFIVCCVFLSDFLPLLMNIKPNTIVSVNQTFVIMDNIAGGILTLLCLQFLTMYETRYSGFCIVLALAVSHIVFLLTLSFSGPALYWIKALLLSLSVVLVFYCFRKVQYFASTTNLGPPIESHAESKVKTGRPTGRVMELSLVISSAMLFPFLYTMVASLHDNSWINPGMYDITAEATGAVVLLLIAAVIFFWHDHLGTEFTILIVHPIFATAILLLPMFWGNDLFISGIMVKCGFLLFNALLWNYLAKLAYRSVSRSFLYMGISTGLMNLFALLGRVVTVSLVEPYASNSETVIYISLSAIWILAMSLLISFLLFRKREKDRLVAIYATQSKTQNSEPFIQQCLEFAKLHELSARETEVLTEFARGRSAGYIAKTMFVSVDTVKTHLKRIYVKCGIHTRQELLDHIDQISINIPLE